MKEEPKSEDRNDRAKMKQELDTPGKVMVTGIPKREDYVDAELEKEFSPYGRITEVNIIRDKRTNIPRGFAFITYENPQDSEDAIKAMEGKDLGGESGVHCEQAVIGFKKSKIINDDGRGWRGGPRGRGARGFDRGHGRGLERGRSRGADRGSGMFNRGMGGGMHRGRGRFEGGVGRMYEEEGYYEEFYEPEPMYDFPPRRGRGGPQPGGYERGRGGPINQGLQPGGYERGRGGGPINHGGPQPRGYERGRGGPISQGPIMRGGRKVLLPDPPVRGRGDGSYPGGSRAAPEEEYYGDDASGYPNRDYYSGSGDPYAEEYEEPYSEEVEYPPEEYYDREQRSARPQGRGAVAPHARRVIPSRDGYEARAPSRQLVEDFGYPAEEVHQRSRAPAGPAAVLRRSGPVYNEDMYDEENVTPADQYGRGRGRQLPSSSAVPSAPSARLGRVAPVNRGGVAPARRAALLEPDPYSQENHGMYNRAAPKGMAVKVAAPAASDYDEDPYADPYMQRVAPAVSRQGVASRPRPALLSSEDVYLADRVQPKAALLGGENMSTRRAAIAGASSRYVDDYQGAGPLNATSRDAYVETRRPVVRRSEQDYRMREDPYQRSASDTDGYVSYPTSSRVPAEPISSDPYSRKRVLDPYGDAPVASSHAVLSARREYDDYRPAVAVPAKRERIERAADRAVYDTYASRQEGAYRGL